MSDIVLSAKGLSKQYRIGTVRESYSTARDTIAAAVASGLKRVRNGGGNPGRRRPGATDETNTIWAVKDVCFDIQRGEVVGIIGRNGAGKSTLLKILSRITDPTEGYADIEGRVGALLEVGTGFHGELSGRENVQLSGAILGMRRAEIARRFDEIVAFAGVERFIDTPVKHYSSGMHLRLAFAVAAHLEPDVLLVDEALAVGDVAFQRKCLGKMQEVGRSGRTVLFVSHDLTAVMGLAPRSILLEGGRVRFDGPSDEAIRLYTEQQSAPIDLLLRRDRGGDGSVRIDALRFLDGSGQTVTTIPSGDPVTFMMTCRSTIGALACEDLALQIRLNDVLGRPVTTFSTRFSGLPDAVLSGVDTFTCHVPALDVAEDAYSVDVWVDFRGAQADLVARAAELQVTPSNRFGTGYAPICRWHGPAIVDHQWRVETPVLV